MIDDLYQDGTDQVLADLVRRPKAEPAPAPPGTFAGAGAAVPKAIGSAVSKSIAFYSDILGAFGDVAGAYPEALGGVALTADQKKQAEAARQKLLAAGPGYSSEGGDAFRARARDLMPDPKTTGAAAHLVHGFVEFAGEIAAAAPLGPLAPGAVAGVTGFDTADTLKQQGVDLATRTKAGAVVGATNAAMVALPMTAATRLGAAAKGVAIGEAGTVGQTAAVQSILKRAGYENLGNQYDPFDPVALAVGLVPGALGAAFHRGPSPRLAEVVLDNESRGKRYAADGSLLTSPKGAQGEMQVMPATARDPGFGVKPAQDGSPEELARVGRDFVAAMQQRYGADDKALAAYNAGPGAVDAAIKTHGDAWLSHLPAETQAYVKRGLGLLDKVAPPEQVAAARVTQVADHIDRARLTPDTDLAGQSAHIDAMEQAHDQIARGDPVNVTDRIDPVAIAERIAADEREAPPPEEGTVRFYRGQRGDFGPATEASSEGRYFTTDRDSAAVYAGRDGAVRYIDVPAEEAGRLQGELAADAQRERFYVPGGSAVLSAEYANRAQQLPGRAADTRLADLAGAAGKLNDARAPVEPTRAEAKATRDAATARHEAAAEREAAAPKAPPAKESAPAFRKDEEVGPEGLDRAAGEIAALHPDLMVHLDGYEPMRVADLLAKVREDAADDAKGADLVTAAVNCLLRNA